MKRIKKETSRAMLGLTQEEMAMLLKVTRSQWSHYEAGNRSLPEGKGVLFLEMVRYMISPETEDLRQAAVQQLIESESKSILEKQLRENEYQLITIGRKISQEQKKFEKYSKAVQQMEFLNSPEQITKAINPEAVSTIRSNTINNFNESYSRLTLLQINEKSLQYEEVLLKESLGKSS